MNTSCSIPIYVSFGCDQGCRQTQMRCGKQLQPHDHASHDHEDPQLSYIVHYFGFGLDAFDECGGERKFFQIGVFLMQHLDQIFFGDFD